ncbi:hypothetical protein XCR_2130 [Xanthomonas campestris pv. raphani 756C]|nr:hypothetical protein XCR_2130 [Xanthomonas campestris pv. raphani 756C]
MLPPDDRRSSRITLKIGPACSKAGPLALKHNAQHNAWRDRIKPAAQGKPCLV